MVIWHILFKDAVRAALSAGPETFENGAVVHLDFLDFKLIDVNRRIGMLVLHIGHRRLDQLCHIDSGCSVHAKLKKTQAPRSTIIPPDSINNKLCFAGC